jgi:carbon monoxide dehydrogenase subunit G
MIEVNEQVFAPAAPRTVWELLSNPEAVVGCVPGASLGEHHDDGTFDAGITVKFGPAKVAFKARVGLALDAAAMTGNVSSRGKDNQGGTRFSAKMTFTVRAQDEPPGSLIDLKAEVEISGRLSSVVEAGAGLVVKKMTADFSERLAARCAELNPAV